MVKCRECEKLKVYFEGYNYCGGNPEEAINRGNHSTFDNVEFEHFECEESANIIAIADVDKERECEDFEDS